MTSLSHTSAAQRAIEEMPARFLPAAAGDLQAVIQFDLSGEGGGRWYVTVAEQTAQVTAGVAASPDLVYCAEAGDYVSILGGRLNPFEALRLGKIRVAGDMQLARRMQTLFDHSPARRVSGP